MSAKTKISTKSITERKNISNEIFQAIVKMRENVLKDEGVSTFPIKTATCGHGIRPFGDSHPNDYIDFAIAFQGQKWSGLGSCDVAAIAKYLTAKCDENGYEWETECLGFADCDFPTKIISFGKPCKEFNQLTKLVATKTKNTLQLKPKDLYSVRLFGKRSTYGESGQRMYYAYMPTQCNRLISEIKTYGRKRVSIEIIKNDDIDTKASAYYETECYGGRDITLKVKAL